ncbi:MAG: hypothetical protein KIH08_07965, partial [Candidatus Freyarchaeota archaeon]|nr:hypothetical protein [Candidatus Jordarchaeia archaeon]
AHAGNYAQMVDYFANIVHVSTIVLEINKNISKGAESGFYKIFIKRGKTLQYFYYPFFAIFFQF